MANIIRLGGAGGGVKLTKILDHGAISTTSSYATASFSDISAYKYALVKIYATIGDTDYAGWYLADVDNIGNGLSFTIYLHRDVRCQITNTSISSTEYGGNYYDIYADIYVTESEILN